MSETLSEKRARIKEIVVHPPFFAEQYYIHGLIKSVMYTEGARAVALAADAYWLLDAIASYQTVQFRRDHPFQVWYLTVNRDDPFGDTVAKSILERVAIAAGEPRKDSEAILSCWDGAALRGSDRPVLTQAIEYTDFPARNIEMRCYKYAERSLIFLPRED
jgi:hypothetical protein